MTTYDQTKLDEITTCPECGAEVYDRSLGAIEFWCGSIIDHDPRKDQEGCASFEDECSE